MDPARMKKLKRLFDRATDLPPDERGPFLHDACEGDDELRRELELLLEEETPGQGSEEETQVLQVALAARRRAADESGRTIGPYELLRKIGEGGMGVVYEALQREPVERRVALKLIKLGVDNEGVIARFEAERQALALMSHPNVAKVLDAGTDDKQRPYFVMEYIQGLPVNAYCDRHKLSPRERIALFILICNGVQHAHQKGIIHRDLKPTNILVETKDGEAVPRIIDFGVAKATSRPLSERAFFTEFGQLVGTPEYMSPEQAEMTPLDVDSRSDVYSLGVVLYELLVGALPFDTRDLRSAGFAELQRKIREDTPHKPSDRLSTLGGEQSRDVAAQRGSNLTSLARACRGDLDWITMKAMEKDRRRRYDSASELAADLRRYLGNQPVLAGPPSLTYRARKFVRRYRLAVGAAAVVALSLVLGAIGTSMGMVRARRAEHRATNEARTAEQVSDFLVDLFRVSDPGEARGNSITAREILDRGVDEIRGSLTDEPEVQGRLLETMGLVYRNLGLYDDALPLLRDAIDRARQVHGERSPELARSQLDLSGLLLLRGKWAEARKVLEDVRAIQQAALRPDHPDRARTANNLGTVYARAGDMEQAREAYREALRIREANLGADHPDVAKVLNNLGRLSLAEGNVATARLEFQRALEIRRRALGEEHHDVAKTMFNLASAHLVAGDLPLAESMMKDALAIQERILGPDHPQVAYNLKNLARVLLKRGELDPALEHCERSLRILERAYPDGHSVVRDSVGLLIEILEERGDSQRVESLRRRYL